MELTKRLKNAMNALRSPTIDVGEEGVLGWLGIDRKTKKISEVTYFTCLKMLSESLGKLPWKYYQNAGQGRIRAEPDDITYLMGTRPNAIMTPTTFWTTVELNCQHEGNAYVWIRKQFMRAGKYGGKVTPLDLWVMPSANVRPLIDNTGVFGDKGKIYYEYNDKYSGEMYVFRQDEVMHFKTWLSFDGIMGEPVSKILEHTINGSLESQKFMNNLYEQGLTASMAMQYTGDLDDARLKKLQNKYSQYLTGSKNAGKIVPVPVGLTLTPLKMNLTDAQFFELRKYSALQIAGAFGIKPNQINNYEKSSYSNSETQNLAFLVDTMSVRIKHYEEEVNYKLLSSQLVKDGYFYKLNEKAILRTDSKTQMENLTKGVNNGIYMPNEAREYLDMPSVEGGDKLIVNGNYIPITDVGKPYEKEVKTDGEN